MSRRNGQDSSQKNTRSRNKNKEPRFAGPNTRSSSVPAPTRLSHPRHEPLPNDNKNISPAATVSRNPSPEASYNQTKSSQDPFLDNSVSLTLFNGPQQGYDSLNSQDNLGASAGMGDNRGSSSNAIPPPPPSPLADKDKLPGITLPDHTDEAFQSTPNDPWHLTFTELRAMRTRMQTLASLESATLDFARQLQAISDRTANTELNVQSHSTKIKVLENEISTLKNTVDSQQIVIKDLQESAQDVLKMKEQMGKNSQAIQGFGKLKNDLLELKRDLNKNTQKNSQELTTLKENIAKNAQPLQDMEKAKKELLEMKQDLSKTTQVIKEGFKKTSHQNITEMNKLVKAQKEQVESFRSIRNDFQQDAQKQESQITQIAAAQKVIQQDVEKKMQQLSEDLDHKSLKDHAFKNRNNIVLIGLPEHEVHSAYSVAMKFFRTHLNLRRLNVENAYRLGQTPAEGSTHIRPLIVKFYRLKDRNLVW